MSRRVDNAPMIDMHGFENHTAEWLAEQTHTSVRTARRWRAVARAPAVVVEYLRLKFDGPLGRISPQWDGWALRDGLLHSPEGINYSPEYLLMIRMRLRQLEISEAELKRLRRERDGMQLPREVQDAADELSELQTRLERALAKLKSRVVG